MPTTNAGRDMIAKALARGFGGAAVGPLFLGIGDGADAFNADQTDLTGSNRPRRALLSNPQVSANVVTLVAEWEPGALTDMNEWGVFDSLSGGVMLSRKLMEELPVHPLHSAQMTATLTVKFPES